MILCSGCSFTIGSHKDEQGNIYIKLKGGIGLGEATGLNVNDFW